MAVSGDGCTCILSCLYPECYEGVSCLLGCCGLLCTLRGSAVGVKNNFWDISNHSKLQKKKKKKRTRALIKCQEKLIE